MPATDYSSELTPFYTPYNEAEDMPWDQKEVCNGLALHTVVTLRMVAGRLVIERDLLRILTTEANPSLSFGRKPNLTLGNRTRSR